MENDICPNVACPIKYDLKTYVDGKATAWGSLGLDNGEKHSITVFGSNGYLFGSSSNAAYSAGNWYRTKLYFDFNKKEITTTVTDIESGLQLYNKTCDIPEGFNKIAFLRIEWTPSGVADSGFSLDNVNVLQSSLYSGIKDVKFLYGENESEDIKADSEKLTGIKLTMNEPLLSEADAKNFLVYDEEGKSVPVSSVTCSDALSAIVTLGEKLKPGSKYFADVKLAASFEGDEASEFDVAKTAFETMATGFAVSDAELTVGDDRFLSPLQLNGKALSAHVNFVNDGEADRSFTTVMTVRSGGLLFDLSVHEVTVPANSTDFSATFTSNVLSGEMDDAMIQLIFVDELKSSKSLIKTVTLNY